MSETPLLAVSNLVKIHKGRGGLWRGRIETTAVNDVSFSIAAGEAFGLVGESGSGKSTVGRAVLMLDPPTSGSVFFEGVNVASGGREALRRLRRGAQPVFQDPYAALSPRMRVADFVEEPLRVHAVERDAKTRRARVEQLFLAVGLGPEHFERYPHTLSGGQCQRVAIARAIALRPRFIVADEPLSALDVSIQAQIVNLLLDLQKSLGLGYLVISHDLNMMRHLCHRIAVLYRGRIVELGPTQALFANPCHPYTRSLLSAIPIPNPAAERARRPLPMEPNAREGEPDSSLFEVSPGHFVAARYGQIAA